jgi:hypothetical protein
MKIQKINVQYAFYVDCTPVDEVNKKNMHQARTTPKDLDQLEDDPTSASL